jgi:hypothetical protein
MKEFYPLDNWHIIEEDLLSPHGLVDPPFEDELDEESMRTLCLEVNRAISKASGRIQKDATWLAVRETITHQHKAEVLVTPQGLNRGISLKLDVSSGECGLEEKLIGKSVQTVPFKVSFVVKKVGPKHPLFQFGGKQMSATVSISNVFKPPFKTPSLAICKNREHFRDQLLQTLRSMPFHLAEPFAKEIREVSPEHPKAKNVFREMSDFLHQFGGFPNRFKKTVTGQIQELGAKFDSEMELSFTETLYHVFVKSKHQYAPPAFQNNIERIFLDRFNLIMSEVVMQMTQQQKNIRQRLTNFSEIESERQRLLSLAQDLDAQKKKGVGDEVLRRHRQDLNKLAQRIHKKIRQYESSKGIILIQELYISSLEKAEHLKLAINHVQEDLKSLKSLLKANHISASRDIQALTQNLGVHANHLLIQHAIYSEVEADMEQVVAIENVGKYDLETVNSALNLMPTVKSALDGQEINSNSLLKTIIDEDIPEAEKRAFTQYCEDHPEPKNNQLQRFNQQVDQFIKISAHGSGVDGIVEFVGKELFTLKAVVRFAAEQNKMSTDFKNHLKYYDKMFMEPYFEVIEKSNHSEFEDLDRSYAKILNSIKTNMDIRYNAMEEKALLSIFRQINGQLQNSNLFAANVFTKQVKNMMAQLAQYKSKISPELMKKILETYTVYMMGSSRTKNLSRSKTGLKNEELDRIRDNHENLTTS